MDLTIITETRLLRESRIPFALLGRGQKTITTARAKEPDYEANSIAMTYRRCQCVVSE